ncbi:MAG: sulfate adenylyltransferase [Nitrososphaerota archaeon]|nr:sulfate adenylyltransferase [Nitrososphaerota archaeon]MDG6911600.1 sulfate adenylyltransferase [Nitrososphaerota archaeon]MDG6940504.1 sulfate adenylyltransferase [Nitrososphaerota archaeon]MDG6960815.1 sulfate adenylyltransferase [Nitrososphaerota archaeon]MDG6962299.1 sulfate adenylyltransferase [Nitrososphaerota archaeon]
MTAASSPGEPYGGKLVDLEVAPEKAQQKLDEASELPKIQPFIDFVYDTEKLAVGAYSPLEGFMDSAAFHRVTSEGRLPNGLPWTIPIIIAIKKDQANEIHEGEKTALLDWNGRTFATLDVSETYPLPKEELAQGAYGTTDQNHPNVADIFNNYGDTALAGKVALLRRLELPTVAHEMTPKETRELFRKRGWRNVVAYQCRNPPHTAHEYIQKVSLERSEVDGLLVQPVIGRLKKGDYRPTVIMDAYRRVVDGYYPKDRAVLSSLSITMRYGGPKAALFLAIVRKNFGATHYIVGRDQAGVGKYYDPYACHKIFDQFDVGIVPLRYMETFYCRACKAMATAKTCPHGEDEHLAVSQTHMRQLLQEGKELPTEILRPEVIAVLKQGDAVLT